MSKQQANELARLIFATHPFIFQAVKQTVKEINLGVPANQLKLLKLIKESSATINHLAEYCHVSAPTMSANIDTLADKGLVIRKRSKQDRRIVNIKLTKKGLNLLTRTHKALVNALSKKLDTLTTNEQKTVQQAMVIIQKTFSPIE